MIWSSPNPSFRSTEPSLYAIYEYLPRLRQKMVLWNVFGSKERKFHALSSKTFILNAHTSFTLGIFAYFNTYRYKLYTWMASKIDKKLALIAADFLTLKNQNRSLPRCCSCYFYACAANIYKYMRQKSKLEFLVNIIVCF